MFIGREIYENISQIVDRIFNSYISKTGNLEPFFAQYSNGTEEKCFCLSKWGTITLANQGLSPIQILRTYYPNDIEIISTDNISDIVETYIGNPLKEGDTAEISLIQRYLNRISLNFPNIPRIMTIDGVLGIDTKNAVKEFQKRFNLKENGIIDNATWYRIVRVYIDIVRLSELANDSMKNEIGKNIPNVILSAGHQGEEVSKLQFLLSYVSEFYPEVPVITQNRDFGDETKNAVTEFQKLFGLTPDGICDYNTWIILYNVYMGIIKNIEIPVPKIIEEIGI